MFALQYFDVCNIATFPSKGRSNRTTPMMLANTSRTTLQAQQCAMESCGTVLVHISSDETDSPTIGHYVSRPLGHCPPVALRHCTMNSSKCFYAPHLLPPHGLAIQNTRFHHMSVRIAGMPPGNADDTAWDAYHAGHPEVPSPSNRLGLEGKLRQQRSRVHSRCIPKCILNPKETLQMTKKNILHHKNWQQKLTCRDVQHGHKASLHF